jgi:hypothetical protein
MEARVAMLISAEALWPQPDAAVKALLININDQSVT